MELSRQTNGECALRQPKIQMNGIALIIAVLMSLLSSSAWAAEQVCPALSSDHYCFRSGTFDKKDERDRQWYSKHLRAMNQPSMWCGNEPDTEYRFTWLRTFHHPVVVRVTNTGNVTRIEAVELNGAGGYSPGQELRRISRPLSSDDWLSIQRAMEAWPLKTPLKSRGLDGSEWIFEERTKRDYKAVAVWSPTSGPARTIGELFLAKAGIMVLPNENY